MHTHTQRKKKNALNVLNKHTYTSVYRQGKCTVTGKKTVPEVTAAKSINSDDVSGLNDGSVKDGGKIKPELCESNNNNKKGDELMIVGNMYYFVECVMICACFIVQLCAFAPLPVSLDRPNRVFSVCVRGVCARRTVGLRLRRYCQCYNLLLFGVVTMRFRLM